jgi:hypothetical protein
MSDMQVDKTFAQSAANGEADETVEFYTRALGLPCADPFCRF